MIMKNRKKNEQQEKEETEGKNNLQNQKKQ